MELLENLIEGLTTLCAKKGLSASTIQENYPQVCLTISEYIRNGIADQIDYATVEDLVQFKGEKSKK